MDVSQGEAQPLKWAMTGSFAFFFLRKAGTEQASPSTKPEERGSYCAKSPPSGAAWEFKQGKKLVVR